MYSLFSYLKKGVAFPRDKLDVLYSKEFIIDFNGKSIPLSLKIKKLDVTLVFEYSWDLKSAGIHALDHHFRIIEQDNPEVFKFQSEKEGFFIYKKKSNNIQIDHTTEWFGETNWRTLDNIVV